MDRTAQQAPTPPPPLPARKTPAEVRGPITERIQDQVDDPVERLRRRRRQLSHDIHHELGTIMMITSLLSTASDVGPASRERARQILGEARWLDQLQRAYEDCTAELDDLAPASVAPIRLDHVAVEVTAAASLSTSTQISVSTVPGWARADRLGYWRAVRNLLGNAVRAAGPHGHVEVVVLLEDGWVVTQIDDDGPGFGAGTRGTGSLGLGIVQDMTATWGGQLQIRRRRSGGCRVRLLLPVAVPPSSGGAAAPEPSILED